MQRVLTCREAERSISHDLDGLVDELGRHALRAHLQSCGPCQWLDTRQRAQQAALRALADVSLPRSLQSFDPDARV